MDTCKCIQHFASRKLAEIDYSHSGSAYTSVPNSKCPKYIGAEFIYFTQLCLRIFIDPKMSKHSSEMKWRCMYQKSTGDEKSLFAPPLLRAWIWICFIPSLLKWSCFLSDFVFWSVNEQLSYFILSPHDGGSQPRNGRAAEARSRAFLRIFLHDV